MNYLIVALLLYLLCLFTVTFGSKVRYDNYHVYQLQPQTKEQLAVVKEMDGAQDSYVFLNAVHYLNSKINVIVAPNKVTEFEESLDTNSISYELVDINAQASLEDEVVEVPNIRAKDYSWRKYYQLNDTYNWLRSLAKEYPDRVSTFVAGESYEGREILGLKISNGPNRKGIFLEAGMHAREWIGPATATFIANQLLTSENKDKRLMAENYDWYILPHANPDGYVYTHTTNRLWRKTRTPYGEDCFGADPNRNWGFHWNEVGASDNPCSDTYAGPKAFSEIETKSLSDYIESNLKDKIFLYISFHSYSQLLLFPYGHTGELPPNYDDLKRIFNVAVAAAAKRYGTRYTGGNIYDAIYPAAGASVDWAYGTQNVKYSFCYELRPSQYALWTGFKLPAEQIIPTGLETLDSLIAMIKEANKTETK